MKRENGYYWTNVHSQWMIVEWKDDTWRFTDCGITQNDNFFDEIGERVIRMKDILSTKKDAEVFFNTIFNDANKPNEELKEAFKKYKDKLT